MKLMYITNDVNVAEIADNVGVDRIFIDLEVNGKEERQKNMDTVKSKHSIEDIKKIKLKVKKANILVRVNPIYDNSKVEIEQVIENGADIIMLPFFKTVTEVESFVKLINNRCKVCLLCETVEAVECIDDILAIEGIDEVHIGLNDLHLGYKKSFMFELLTDGTVENLCNKFRNKGIAYGFGGIGRFGQGELPAELILKEHIRNKSNLVILSRSFCNVEKINDFKEIEKIFSQGVKEFRNKYKIYKDLSKEDLDINQVKIKEIVNLIVMEKKNESKI